MLSITMLSTATVQPPGGKPMRPGHQNSNGTHDRSERRTRVLLVDDEPQFLQGLARVLRRAAIDCSLACSGPDAVALLREGQRFDAALLDMRMPGMDGLDTMHALHRIEPALPVAFCTGGDLDSERLGRVTHEGARFILEKPVDAPALVDAIHALCTRNGGPPPGDQQESGSA